MVFEPRWWQKLCLRACFAAGGLMAAAILAHGFMRPVAGPVNATAQVDTAAITARVTAEVSQRLRAEMVATVNTAVGAAVTRAVADTEKRDDQRTALLLAGTERRYADTAEYMNKQVTRMYALNTGAGVR